MPNGNGNSGKAPSLVKNPEKTLGKSKGKKSFGLSSKPKDFGKDKVSMKKVSTFAFSICTFCRCCEIFCASCSGASDVELNDEEIVL